MRIKSFLFLAFLLTGFLLFSCRKDKIITDPGAKLQFSSDKVLFDTVFSTIGSTSRSFRVYNNNKQTISISNIRLGGGSSSPFKVNVDGSPLNGSLQNIQIAAKDSMYIFVRITVNPSPSNVMVIMDSIMFECNGNHQQVLLQAIGQNVYLHRPDHYILLSDGSSVPYSIANTTSPWPTDKPHLVFDYLVVDSGTTLNMAAGTRMFMHNNAVLWVYKDGTLNVQGSFQQPVTFCGDRMEPAYSDVPGQWGNIWLSPLSRNNQINWAVIKNASIGIRADTVDPTSGNPTLRLSNTLIQNMSVAGIYGQGASIVAANVAVMNCGQYSAALTIGGSYSFRQCSFSDSYSLSNRTTPQILVSNWYKDVKGVVQTRNLDSAHFYNCIVWGTLAEELKMDSSMAGGVHFNYQYYQCLLKTGNTNAIDRRFHGNNPNGVNDPLFDDPNANLRLGAGSGAIGIGQPFPGGPIHTSLNNKPSDVYPNDVGAYQH
jgi:hypothetical protein